MLFGGAMYICSMIFLDQHHYFAWSFPHFEVVKHGARLARLPWSRWEASCFSSISALHGFLGRGLTNQLLLPGFL